MSITSRAKGLAGSLRSQRAELLADSRAQGGSNLVRLIIGVMISVVIGVAVAIPVINDTIASSNISGTTLLIVGLIPTFIGLMLLVSTVSPLMNRY